MPPYLRTCLAILSIITRCAFTFVGVDSINTFPIYTWIRSTVINV